jgi:hypothetical protein
MVGDNPGRSKVSIPKTGQTQTAIGGKPPAGGLGGLDRHLHCHGERPSACVRAI